MTNHLPVSDRKASALPNDLPEESAAAIMRTMVDVVREEVSVEIGVTREMLPSRGVNLSMFVVTLPPRLSKKQRSEIDACLQEIGGLFRYAEE